MKTRSPLSTFLAAISLISTVYGGEHFTLIAEKPTSGVGESGTISLNAGDTAQLIFASGGAPQGFRMVATLENSTFEVDALKAALPSGTYSTNPVKLVGPGSLKMKLGYDGFPSGGSEKQFATVEVNRAGIDGNPAAIPVEAGTTWKVILEASTDLVN